jgi:hypothetical protein
MRHLLSAKSERRIPRSRTTRDLILIGGLRRSSLVRGWLTNVDAELGLPELVRPMPATPGKPPSAAGWAVEFNGTHRRH